MIPKKEHFLEQKEKEARENYQKLIKELTSKIISKLPNGEVDVTDYPDRVIELVCKDLRNNNWYYNRYTKGFLNVRYILNVYECRQKGRS